MSISYAKRKGGDVTMKDHTPSSAITEGDVVNVNGRLMIAHAAIAANALGALAAEGGLYLLPKATSDGGWSDGQPIYWDATNFKATRTASGNLPFGFAFGDAATGDTTATVYHDPDSVTMAYVATAASTAVSNTTTETNFDKSMTIPANFLRAGDVIRVTAQAIATSTNSTDTLNIKLKLGTTDVVATGAVDVANNDIGLITASITIRSVGASGKFVAAGSASLGAAGTATMKPVNKAETTVDTTAALAVACSATWSAASASDSCRLDVMNVEIIRS